MKRGERVGVGLMIGVFGALLVLTVYLEMGYQRHASDKPSAQDTHTHRMLAMLPKGFQPDQLPEPESTGAKTLSLYCVQCHELPLPAMHTAQEWEQVLARMRLHMNERGGGMLMRILVPGAREEAAVGAYLAQHALRAVAPDALPDAATPAAAAYVQVCSGCHAVPEPTIHNSSEWTLTVLRMKQYMQDGAFPIPDEQTMGLVYRYLARHGVTRGNSVGAGIYTLRGHKLRFMKRICTPSLNVPQSKNAQCSGATPALYLNQNVQIVSTSAFPKTHFMTAQGIARDSWVGWKAAGRRFYSDVPDNNVSRRPPRA